MLPCSLRCDDRPVEMSLAARALEAIKAYFPQSPIARDLGSELLDSWVEDPDIVCLVYPAVYGDFTVGLRTRVDLDPDDTLSDWVEGVVDEDVSEPLGTFADHMWRDSDGIFWWGLIPPPGRGGEPANPVPPEADPGPPNGEVWASGHTTRVLSSRVRLLS